MRFFVTLMLDFGSTTDRVDACIRAEYSTDRDDPNPTTVPPVPMPPALDTNDTSAVARYWYESAEFFRRD